MSPRRSNLKLAFSLMLVVLSMGALAYASVPLYRIFCRTTGFGGTAIAATRPLPPVGSRLMTVQFDANVAPGLDWKFTPQQRSVRVKLGEEKTIEYIATNRGDTDATGTATFNISPVKAGIYFQKLQCFCFTKQTIPAHATRRLSVSFFVDPSLGDAPDLDDVSSLTLSYTFFPVERK